MLEVQSVTFDCADPYGLAEWWSRAPGGPWSTPSPATTRSLLDPPPDGRHQPPLLFIKVPEGKR